MNDNDTVATAKPPRRPPWNKGKLVGPKPPLKVSHIWSIRTKMKTDDRTRDLALFNLAIDSKLRTRLRSRRLACRRCRPAWAHCRPGDGEAEENRAAGSLRIDRSHPRSHRCLLARDRPNRRPVPVSWPSRPGGASDDTAIRPAGRRMGGKYRTRPAGVRHALHAAHEGDVDLPQNRKSTCGTTFTGPYENRKHRALPRHRGR